MTDHHDPHKQEEHGHAAPQEEKPAFQANPEINFFAATNFRNQNRKFGIKIDDRRRHMYVVGKTGMGKTTLLENMVLNDIYAGHGVGLVDPHGDFAEKILNYIPSNRINDVVYFNPADINFPIGFNILETVNPEHRHLVASGLMGVFKKIWPDVWSARMEYILNNTILALLDYPGTTLLGINRLLAEADYRDKVVKSLKDPVVKAFWQNEFAGYTEKFRTEAVAPIQNKIGQFLSASVIRNIVAQVKSRINIREIMDQKKIFIMNLSKGRIGEDNSRLLGGMLITKLQLAAMERVDIPEKDRKDFFLYVDEFQNFATESFANILSEARKYRLDLIMAHQYMEQLDEKVLAAVIGNVGTMVTYRVGSSDAEILAKEFTPTFVEEDLVNLPKFQVYLKLMIDGVASRPFSAQTLPPIGSPTGSTEKVVRVSRERYAVAREKIEEKIMRWSGMLPGASEDDEDEMGETDVKPKAVGPSPVVNLRSTTFGNPPKPAIVEPVTAVRPPRPERRSDDRRGNDRRPERNDRDRDRDRGNRPPRPKQQPSGTPQKVLLVDPNQKGISLSQAVEQSPRPAPKETSKVEVPKGAAVHGTKLNAQPIVEIKKIEVQPALPPNSTEQKSALTTAPQKIVVPEEAVVTKPIVTEIPVVHTAKPAVLTVPTDAPPKELKPTEVKPEVKSEPKHLEIPVENTPKQLENTPKSDVPKEIAPNTVIKLDDLDKK